MADKVKAGFLRRNKLVLYAMCFIVCVIGANHLVAAFLRFRENSKPLLVNPAGVQALPIQAPFPAPKNVQITLYPSSQDPDSVRVSWSPVPGARYYRVYTATAVPDSSLLIPHVELLIMPDGTRRWEYKYDKHPIFGDVLIRKLHSDSAPLTMHCYGGPGSNTVAKYTTFEPAQVGRFEGCSYIYPLNGERDRFFVVRAVR